MKGSNSKFGPARLLLLVAALAAVAALVAGCGGGSDDDGGGGETNAAAGESNPAAGESSDASVAMLALSTQCEFCAKVLKGTEEAVKGAGASFEAKISNFDAAEQAQQANQTIAQRPDAVVVYPADATAILPSLQKMMAAGISVVVVDSMPPREHEEFWDAYRGANDALYGTSAAKAMIAGMKAKGLPESGNLLVITGTPNSPATVIRMANFKKTLAAEAPGLKVLAAEPGEWDQAAAQTAAANLFTRYSGEKIAGVYAQADNMLAGAIEAAEGAGLEPKKMVMVGSNCTVQGVENIDNGKQYATFLDDGRAEGKLAGETALELAAGDSVEKYVYTPGTTITKGKTGKCAAANR